MLHFTFSQKAFSPHSDTAGGSFRLDFLPRTCRLGELGIKPPVEPHPPLNGTEEWSVDSLEV